MTIEDILADPEAANDPALPRRRPAPVPSPEPVSVNAPPDAPNDLIHQAAANKSAVEAPTMPAPPSDLFAQDRSGQTKPAPGPGLPEIREPDILSQVPQLHADISSIPASKRLTGLQTQLDTLRHPQPMSTGRKWLRLGMLAAPVAAGAIFGGKAGAMGGAEGDVQALNTEYTRKKEMEDQLLREIGQEQTAQTGQYGAQLHMAGLNAQNIANAAWREAMIRSRGDIANQRDTTNLNIAGGRNATTDLIHGYDAQGQPLDQSKLSARDRAYVEHANAQEELMKSQEELNRARAAGIPEQIASAEAFHQSMMMRAQTAQDALLASLFGTYHGQPIPGMPTMPDAAGNPTVIGTKPYAATGPTGTTRTKIDQANAIQASSTNLVAFIKEHRNELGPVMGRVNNIEDLIGNVGPDASEMRALITSYAALHPALHGFRGQSALKGFEQAIGGMKKNPDAMIAAIEGLTRSANVAKEGFQQGSGKGYVRPAPARPTGTPNNNRLGRGKNPLNLNLPQ